jgi:hypothetical protein
MRNELSITAVQYGHIYVHNGSQTTMDVYVHSGSERVKSTFDTYNFPWVWTFNKIITKDCKCLAGLSPWLEWRLTFFEIMFRGAIYFLF